MWSLSADSANVSAKTINEKVWRDLTDKSKKIKKDRNELNREWEDQKYSP